MKKLFKIQDEQPGALKTAPVVPAKATKPKLSPSPPSKDKKPPAAPTSLPGKGKPAPTIPTKRKDDEEKKRVVKKKEKKRRDADESTETTKDDEKDAHNALLDENKALKKQIEVLKSNALDAQDAQANRLLTILAQVNAARAWNAKVVALQPLLGLLKELQSFEASAPSVVANKEHAEAMHALDLLCAPLRSKGGKDADVAKVEQQCQTAAHDVYTSFGSVQLMESNDEPTITGLVNRIDEALAAVASKVPPPSKIPPFAITRVVDDFVTYKTSFEGTVVPSHNKIAEIIAKLDATLQESQAMTDIVNNADEEFDRLFVNIRHYVDTFRTRQPDPEADELRGHYAAQLAALERAAADRKAAKVSVDMREKLATEIKNARKHVRGLERELEDLRDDGDVVAGSPEEAKRLNDINTARGTLAELERRDEEAAAIAESDMGAPAVAPAAATSALSTRRNPPMELAARRLDAAYTYEPLAEGVLKATLHGADAPCVLKVTQKPAEAELKAELVALGDMCHPNLVPVETAFVDGPHLYVHTPFYAAGNLDTWLDTKPEPAQIQCAMFGVLSALGYMHDRGYAHGRIRPHTVLLQNADGASVLSSFWTGAVAGAAADPDDFIAPEVAQGLPATPASDIFSSGLLLLKATGHTVPTRTQPATDALSLPKIKDKVLSELIHSMCDADPQKRPAALATLLHPFFSPQYVVLPRLVDSNDALSSARAALAALAEKNKKHLLPEDAMVSTLALLNDATVFDSPEVLCLPVASEDVDIVVKVERTGVSLLHALLRQHPMVVTLAPVALQYLLGALPSSVRDLLRAMNLFDTQRARHFRRIRLIPDVNVLNLTMADGTPVTNTNREAYLQETLSFELIDSRKTTLDKLRAGFFSLSGVKDELRQLRPSELAVLLAGEQYIAGELVLNAAIVEPIDADITSFGAVVRQLSPDNVRRLLYAATGVAAPKAPITIAKRVSPDSHAAKILFVPLFARIELEYGAEADLAQALSDALARIDQPLRN